MLKMTHLDFLMCWVLIVLIGIPWKVYNLFFIKSAFLLSELF